MQTIARRVLFSGAFVLIYTTYSMQQYDYIHYQRISNETINNKRKYKIHPSTTNDDNSFSQQPGKRYKQSTPSIQSADQIIAPYKEEFNKIQTAETLVSLYNASNAHCAEPSLSQLPPEKLERWFEHYAKKFMVDQAYWTGEHVLPWPNVPESQP